MKKYIITVVILILIPLSTRADIYGSSLIAWFRMDNNDISGATLTNRSGTVSNGTLVSSPTTGVAGKSGQAITLDGSSQYIDVPYSSALAPVTITLMGWFKLTSVPGASGFDTLIGRGADSIAPNPIPWFMDFRDNTSGSIPCGVTTCNLSFLTYSGLTTSGVISNTNFATASNIGKWFQFAGVYDGTNYMIYINGKLENSATGSFGLQTGTRDMIIGAFNNNGPVGRYFPGTIDDVRVYNRALSASEIQQDYYSTRGGGHSKYY